MNPSSTGAGLAGWLAAVLAVACPGCGGPGPVAQIADASLAAAGSVASHSSQVARDTARYAASAPERAGRLRGRVDDVAGDLAADTARNARRTWHDPRYPPDEALRDQGGALARARDRLFGTSRSESDPNTAQIASDVRRRKELRERGYSKRQIYALQNRNRRQDPGGVRDRPSRGDSGRGRGDMAQRSRFGGARESAADARLRKETRDGGFDHRKAYAAQIDRGAGRGGGGWRSKAGSAEGRGAAYDPRGRPVSRAGYRQDLSGNPGGPRRWFPWARRGRAGGDEPTVMDNLAP